MRSRRVASKLCFRLRGPEGPLYQLDCGELSLRPLSLHARCGALYHFVSDFDLLGRVRAVTIVALRFRFVLVAEIQYLWFVLLLMGCAWLD